MCLQLMDTPRRWYEDISLGRLQISGKSLNALGTSGLYVSVTSLVVLTSFQETGGSCRFYLSRGCMTSRRMVIQRVEIP